MIAEKLNAKQSKRRSPNIYMRYTGQEELPFQKDGSQERPAPPRTPGRSSVDSARDGGIREVRAERPRSDKPFSGRPVVASEAARLRYTQERAREGVREGGRDGDLERPQDRR